MTPADFITAVRALLDRAPPDDPIVAAVAAALDGHSGPADQPVAPQAPPPNDALAKLLAARRARAKPKRRIGGPPPGMRARLEADKTLTVLNGADFDSGSPYSWPAWVGPGLDPRVT